MSDARSNAPPDELLEFLGDIDEANDPSLDEDFVDFLARIDLDRRRAIRPAPKPPVKGPQDE